jgi:hypothetical protein
MKQEAGSKKKKGKPVFSSGSRLLDMPKWKHVIEYEGTRYRAAPAIILREIGGKLGALPCFRAENRVASPISRL